MSYSKYYIYKEKISFDGGVTWQDTGQATPSGNPIGIYETLGECEGVVPPTPTNKKLVAYYSDGKTLEVECNSSGTLTSGETQPSGYQASAMTNAVIGNCVTRLGYKAFSGCTSLTSVTIPNSVTSIGYGAFEYCRSLTSVTIPNSVTYIDNNVFYNCTGLTGVTILATTPPTLGINVFYNTSNCPLLVPASSVNTYKSASGWSEYASRIQAIP